LKALQAAKTTHPLAQQFQTALNDMSTPHKVGLYWVAGHAGVRRNEITDKLARDGSDRKFVGAEPSLRVSKQNIKRKIKRWAVNQHLAKMA
jgi:ribonuclease HI